MKAMSWVVLMTTVTSALAGPSTLKFDEEQVYEEAGVQPQSQRDPALSCLGSGGKEICCRNCTSCCKERGRCNVGEDNHGWGNLGSGNFGDFNFGNNSRGDCNMEDESFGIGGPIYAGCPKETWDHIITFCALIPYYHKCHSPPHYFGDELIDKLAAVVRKCDSNIQIKPRQKIKQPVRRVRRKSIKRTTVPRQVG